ncbi:MAG TPA: hypothetical protein VMV70_07870, partial [Gallionella sp.]|nr:hypothetical protein [Gallionella sp.]
PNIVGDGINVAQRVMGFADVAQILVSRSYYDAVSRLSPQYAGMFHYQGSRTDKHVREHEVYAIGYPGDKTTRRGAAIPPVVAEVEENKLADAMVRVKSGWRLATTRVHAWSDLAILRFREADTGQRAIYAAAVAIPLLLLIALLTNWAIRHTPTEKLATTSELANTLPQSGPAGASVASASTDTKVGSKQAIAARTLAESRTRGKESVESKHAKAVARNKSKPKAKLEGKSSIANNQASATNKSDTEYNSTYITSSGSKNSYIVVTCMEGTEVFVDGISKGRTDKSPLSILVSPGKHSLILSNASKGIFTQSVRLSTGKIVHIKPNRCN